MIKKILKILKILKIYFMIMGVLFLIKITEIHFKNSYIFHSENDLSSKKVLYLDYKFKIRIDDKENVKLNNIEIYELNIKREDMYSLKNIEEKDIIKKIFSEDIVSKNKEYRIKSEKLEKIFFEYGDKINEKVFLIRISYYDDSEKIFSKSEILVSDIFYRKKGIEFFIPNI